MKRTGWWQSLLVVFMVAIFFAMPVHSSSEVVIDFADTTGYGVGEDLIMVENIRVEVRVVPPFGDPLRPEISTFEYNVPFRWDNNGFYLAPALDAVVDTDDQSARCADLTVNVTDAYNGTPLTRASVSVGSATVTTDATGVALFSGLLAGNNRVTATAADYQSGDRQVTLDCTSPRSVGLALSPLSGSGAIGADEVRIVLTWGENPSDLDSHLTGPSASSSGINDEDNRFHVYYASRIHDVAALDVDDTSSYGPETITISPPIGSGYLRPGLYRYSVYHFSGSETIATSDASVTLHLGGSQRNFTPPADSTLSGSGDLWTVFELQVNSAGAVTVYPVNTYSQASSSTVRTTTGTGLGEVESGIDFIRLPQK